MEGGKEMTYVEDTLEMSHFLNLRKTKQKKKERKKNKKQKNQTDNR